MTSMSHWTDGQWTAFVLTIAAGLAAAVLLYLARARAGHTSTPRPSLMPPQRRMLIDRDMRAVLADAYDAYDGNYHGTWIEPTRPVPVIAGGWSDPQAMSETDFTDPGIGALASIQAVRADPALVTGAELNAWINAYADLRPLMPETAATAEAMRIALEPAERKMRLWRVRGEGGPARRALNDWRMDTPTGAYPVIAPAQV